MSQYKKTTGCQVQNLSDIYHDYFGYITTGSFVEIGAFNCFNWSNTYTLALSGWRGLMVEPQPQYIDECKELYVENPNIIFQQCCVGRSNGTVKLYIGGSTSTIKRGMIKTYNSIEWAKFGGLDKDRFIECDIFTLDTLLSKNNWTANFEVLVIDVEGAEIDVLAGFDLDYWQPQMIIIEAHEQMEDKRLSGKAGKIDLFFNDYTKIYSDHINNIYVL